MRTLNRRLSLWACVLPTIILLLNFCNTPAEAATPSVHKVPNTVSPLMRPAAPQTIVERTVTGDNVTVATLSNGMTVIVKPVRTAPVVCVKAYVRAGGLYEGKWLGCGLSHLLEHLVAKGAVHGHDGPGQQAAQKPKQTRDRISEIGGQSNAYTSMTHTCYYIAASSSKTMDCIDLIADWMARPAITPEDFKREHGVVQRELEMGKDEPRRQQYQTHLANAFGTHPASVPVIGYAKPLSEVTLQDVLDYHGQMYVPQNMVFCVVGDFETDAVLKRICKAMTGFDKGRTPELSLPEVKPLSGVRRVVSANPAVTDVMAQMSFQTIELLHDDLYALDVLSYILTKGRSSRLVQKIKREKHLVTSVSSSSWTPQWGKGIFSLSFRAEPGKADAAEKAILDELRAIVNGAASSAITPAELTRAKRQKIADMVYGRQSVEDFASNLATDYLSAGDVAFSENYTKRIQSVTAAQVLAAAKKYFVFDRMAMTRIVPPGMETTADNASATATAKSGVTVFKVHPALTVVLHPTKNVGLVSMTYATKGGVLVETDETNGLGTLVTSLSTRGTTGRTAEQIAAFFDSAGGAIAGSCGNNSFYWRATVLDDSFGEAVKILGDVICSPKFTQKELDTLRPGLLRQIRQSAIHRDSQMRKHFREKFFTGSPYARLSSGSESVVEKADPARLQEFYLKHVAPSPNRPAVLAIYGNFDVEEARKLVSEAFKSTPSNTAAAIAEFPQRKVSEKVELHVLKTPHKAAGIMVAAPGMKVTNIKDRVAITVLDTIISGYQLPSGWLHSELRGKRLVYVVHAYNWAGLQPGAFVTYAVGQPQNAKEIVDIILANLRKASQYTPTQEEIDIAVNTILTADALGNQSAGSISMSSALDELYGFGHDFRIKIQQEYRKVTPADVERVGKKYLSGGYVVTVTTPQPELLEEKTQKPDAEQPESN